ncbi:MAG: hypothetical protein ACJ75B_16960 [Flavisolibacter sp.]
MKNRILNIFLCLTVSAVVNTVFAQLNNNDAKMHAGIKSNCESLRPQFEKIKAWVNAHKGSKPEIPVPPVLDPDCVACRDTMGYEDKNQSIIDSFNARAQQPEISMIKMIMDIAREKALVGEGGNIFPGDHLPNKGNYPCYDEMQDGDLMSFLEFLGNRLQYKATAMLLKYKASPQYFYGGLSFYLGTIRQSALLGLSYPDVANPDLREWTMNYYNKFQERLLQQYQYQLYPEMLSLPRQMALLGLDLDYRKLTKKEEEYSITNVDGAIEAMNKAITFMHFKLKMEIKANGHGDNGAQLSCIMSGETEIRCVKYGSCYVWEGEEGDMIKFTVKELIFENSSGILVYQGPREFMNPFKLSVDLCGENPEFALDIQSFGPPEENYKVSKPGGESEDLKLDGIISNLFSSIMGDQAIERFKKMESQQSSGLEAELEGIAQRHEAHKNDPGYSKTEQGKKDLKRWKQLQKQFGMENGQQPDVTTEMTKIRTEFKTGNSMPVDETVKAKLLTSHSGGAGWDYATLILTLEEFPDTRDNLK